MGQSLSEPKTEKDTSSVKNEYFEVASSSMQGWRIAPDKIDQFVWFQAELPVDGPAVPVETQATPLLLRSPIGLEGARQGDLYMGFQVCESRLTELDCQRTEEMEDAHSVQLPLDKDKDSAYFAVFDGHGSDRFSQYCSYHLHQLLVSSTDYREGRYTYSLQNAFLELDHQLQEDPKLKFQYEPGGTTAVVVLVKDGNIFCANAGDSRAIVSVNGIAQELSHDHKPFHPAEERRISNAGGWVEFNRVNGNLALSRAIGDFNYKGDSELKAEKQIISAEPEIITSDITPEHEFIVLACDGVWDVMSNQEVVDFILSKIAEQMKPEEICESLLDNCLAPDCRMGGLGCDNMTVIIAFFLHGGKFNELAARSTIVSPVEGSTARTNSVKETMSNGLLPNAKDSTENSRGSVDTESTPCTSKLYTSCSVRTYPGGVQGVKCREEFSDTQVNNDEWEEDEYAEAQDPDIETDCVPVQTTAT